MRPERNRIAHRQRRIDLQHHQHVLRLANHQMTALIGVGGQLAHHRQRAFDQPVHRRMHVRQLEQLQRQPEAVRLRAENIAALLQQKQDAVDFVDRASEARRDLGLGQRFGAGGHELQNVERLFHCRHAIAVAAAFAFLKRLDSAGGHHATFRFEFALPAVAVKAVQPVGEFRRRCIAGDGRGRMRRAFAEEGNEARMRRAQIGRGDRLQRRAEEISAEID